MDNCIKSGRKAALALKIQNSDQEACFAINFQPRTNEVSQNSPDLFLISFFLKKTVHHYAGFSNLSSIENTLFVTQDVK